MVVEKSKQSITTGLSRIIKSIDSYGKQGCVAHIKITGIKSLDIISLTLYNTMLYMESRYAATVLRLPNNEIIIYASTNEVSEVLRDDVVSILYPLTDIGVDVSSIIDFYFLSSAFDKEEILKIIRIMHKVVSANEKSNATVTQLSLSNIGSIHHMIDSIPDKLLSKLVMRQPIVNIQGGDATILSNEYYLSMKTLQRIMPNNVMLIKPPMLFLSLFSVLDQKIMSFFKTRRFKNKINVNLSLDTLYSKEFEAFDDYVGDHADKWTIELHNHDIFSDLDRFFKIAPKMHDRGYRLALDGLSLQNMIVTDLGNLPFDLFKFDWSNNYSRSGLEEIEATVYLIGNEKVILAKTDSQDAIKYGMSLGIDNYQGFFFDHMFKKKK